MAYRDETERIIAKEFQGMPKHRDKMIDSHRENVAKNFREHPELAARAKEESTHRYTR